MEAKSVVRPWLNALPLMQQTVVLCALRGCDGLRKEDPSKQLVRSLRATVLYNAQEESQFMSIPSGISAEQFLLQKLHQFLESVDHYPLHWYAHFMHAAEIIGYKHPNEQTSHYWFTVYVEMVYALHLNVESEKELDKRLSV
jgi:hypothetical protein